MKESFQHQEVMSLLDGDLRAFPDFLLQANRPFHFLNQRDQMAYAQLATGGVRQKGENSFVIRVNFEVLTSASDNMAAVVVYRSKDVWGPHRVYAGSTESIPPGQMSKMPCDEALKFLK